MTDTSKIDLSKINSHITIHSDDNGDIVFEPYIRIEKNADGVEQTILYTPLQFVNKMRWQSPKSKYRNDGFPAYTKKIIK
jgi:hypothetical protein